jgi:protein gp37
MAERTRIEWVDHTFNPWIGCTRVSPACDNCCAAAMAHRRRWARFEARAPRRRTSAGNWLLPLRWNRKAEAAGIRAKVFGPSLADPFDAEVPTEWREDYLQLIEATPSLDWILLTKRPLVARRFFTGRKVPENLWPGITAENQSMLDLRAPHLLAIDARVRVVSAEPLLGSLDLSRWSAGLG